MPTIRRYCPKCDAFTAHTMAVPPRLRWWWALFYPLLWLLARMTGPPACIPCLERGTRGDDLADDVD
jgi:hypothetical protein